jgi:hypothetical protein
MILKNRSSLKYSKFRNNQTKINTRVWFNNTEFSGNLQRITGIKGIRRQASGGQKRDLCSLVTLDFTFSSVQGYFLST